jgi:hypothetical protein
MIALAPANRPRMCWLNGKLGTGKSAAARSIAEELSKQGRLAASFFFSRRAGRNSVRYLIPNIAVQLISSIPALEVPIMAAIRDPFILNQRLVYQFQQLIIDPIQKLRSPLSSMVIVVDGIDECNDEEDLVMELITLIADAQKNSHHPLQFFLASRPEPYITAEFSEHDTHTFSLEDFDAEHDIRVFLRHRFREISKKRGAIVQKTASRWPSDADVETLVHRASGLFIFAATVMQFIGDKHGNPVHRLKQIVEVESQESPSPYLELDRLYTQILETAPEVDTLRMVLGIIIVLFEPLPLGELERLLSSENGDILLALETLHSILIIPADNNKPVTMYHESLRDFLLASKRSKKYCIDLPACNGIIAHYCLELLVSKFERSFCALRHPDIFDSVLWYACDYWAIHLLDSLASVELVVDLKNFGVDSLLCWIEALGLSNDMDKALRSVQAVNQWVIAKVSNSRHVCISK